MRDNFPKFLLLGLVLVLVLWGTSGCGLCGLTSRWVDEPKPVEEAPEGALVEALPQNTTGENPGSLDPKVPEKLELPSGLKIRLPSIDLQLRVDYYKDSQLRRSEEYQGIVLVLYNREGKPVGSWIIQEEIVAFWNTNPAQGLAIQDSTFINEAERPLSLPKPSLTVPAGPNLVLPGSSVAPTSTPTSAICLVGKAVPAGQVFWVLANGILWEYPDFHFDGSETLTGVPMEQGGASFCQTSRTAGDLTVWTIWPPDPEAMPTATPTPAIVEETTPTPPPVSNETCPNGQLVPAGDRMWVLSNNELHESDSYKFAGTETLTGISKEQDGFVFCQTDRKGGGQRELWWKKS